MGVSAAAMVTAIASAAAVIITALRKRRDLDLTELQRLVNDLKTRVGLLEDILDKTRVELVRSDRNVFSLRRTLAQHGIDDPTQEAS